LGGGYAVLSSEIHTNFLSVLNDERVALIFSLWVIILSMLLLTLVNRLLRATTREYTRGIAPVIYPLGRWRPLVTALVVALLVVLLAPFLHTVVQSFFTIWGYSILPSGLTIQNYLAIFANRTLLFDTLELVLVSTSIIVVTALVLGDQLYFRKRYRFIDYILVIPFILPGIVLSVGVLSAYAEVIPSTLPIPFSLLLLGTVVVRRLPYSLKTMEAGFLVADKRREEVSRSLGAGKIRSFFLITFPQMKSFLFAAFVIGLVKTSTELSASLILAPADWQSLSLAIVYQIDQGALPLASALSVVLVLIIGSGTTVVAFWSHTPLDDQSRQSQEALERLVLGRSPVPLIGPPKSSGRRGSLNLYKRSREPLVICEDHLGITEVNGAFLKLVGADSLGQLQAESSFSMLFFGDREVLEVFSTMEKMEHRPTSLMVLDGRRVPILLDAFVVKTGNGHRKGIFHCRKVTGHSRRIQEYNRLRERMVVAEQMALKAQITPHFLFNSLNSVMDLVETDPKEANDTLQNLADLYRYILYSTKQDLVPLDEEIAAIHHYLQVEKSRFGDKLRFSIVKSNDLFDFVIPPMLLQPIVENAVTHGAKENGDIDVVMDIHKARENVIIRIEDSGDTEFNPIRVGTGTGTGLKNVEGRLFALYHRRIVYERKKGGGLVVTLTIPLQMK
jgi:ABC-type spermidine/putrescine transport system permease subunit II